MTYNAIALAEASASSSHKITAMHEKTIAETPARIAEVEADLVRFREKGWDFLIKSSESRIESYKRQLAFAEEHIASSRESAERWDSRAAQRRADELDGVAGRW